MATTATTSTIPREQNALKIESAGTLKLSSTLLPSFRQDQVLIRVENIALNPVDAKSADLSPTPGATSGADFAGTIVAVGSALRRPLNIGDRVFGCVFGNNPDEKENGAFAEYVVAYADLVWKVPELLSFENTSCLGVGLVTVGLALYFEMGLRLPELSSRARKGEDNGQRQFVLVSGGATATGMLAIQMLQLSGYDPIAICSPQSSAHCRSLGAVACFDYHSPTCGADIRAYTNNTLKFAFDCISASDSMKICYAAIASPLSQADGQLSEKGDSNDSNLEKARYVALDPFPIRGHTRRSIRPRWIIAFTVLDQPVNWQYPFQREPKPEHRNWAGRVWVPLVQNLLDHQMLRGPSIEVRDGGLGSVMEGLSDIRMGIIHGRKLVYAI